MFTSTTHTPRSPPTRRAAARPRTSPGSCATRGATAPGIRSASSPPPGVERASRDAQDVLGHPFAGPGDAGVVREIVDFDDHRPLRRLDAVDPVELEPERPAAPGRELGVLRHDRDGLRPPAGPPPRPRATPRPHPRPPP